jgi:hypothetical protein
LRNALGCLAVDGGEGEFYCRTHVAGDVVKINYAGDHQLLKRGPLVAHNRIDVKCAVCSQVTVENEQEWFGWAGGTSD